MNFEQRVTYAMNGTLSERVLVEYAWVRLPHTISIPVQNRDGEQVVVQPFWIDMHFEKYPQEHPRIGQWNPFQAVLPDIGGQKGKWLLWDGGKGHIIDASRVDPESAETIINPWWKVASGFTEDGEILFRDGILVRDIDPGLTFQPTD